MCATNTGTHSWPGQSDVSEDRKETEAGSWMGLQSCISEVSLNLNQPPSSLS